jgi:predicted CoA-binding protein
MRVMIVGASTNPEKFGHRSVVAHLESGYEVVPINPTADEIAGLPVHAGVADPAGPFDRASIYLPRDAALAALDAIAARGDVNEVWLNPGADHPDVVARAGELGLTTIRACSIMDTGRPH